MTKEVKGELLNESPPGGSREAAKRAHKAIQAMGEFVLERGEYGLLFKRVEHEGEWVVRAYVPQGGLRSFWFNGRRYRLTLRRQMLLLYHDSELIGAHSSARDSLAKMSLVVFWPTMEKDMTKWVQGCSICRMVKPVHAEDGKGLDCRKPPS